MDGRADRHVSSVSAAHAVCCGDAGKGAHRALRGFVRAIHQRSEGEPQPGRAGAQLSRIAGQAKIRDFMVETSLLPLICQAILAIHDSQPLLVASHED